MPTVKIRDIEVNYQEFGEGRPLLIIHGFPGNGRRFAALYEPFFKERTGWRRLYPDLLDYGDGGIPASVNSTDAIADILIDFMGAVAPGERFIMIGASWGAYLARRLVQHYLHQLDGVQLFVPMMEWGFVGTEQQILRRDPEFEAALQPREIEDGLQSTFAAPSKGILEKFRAQVDANWKEEVREVAAPLWNSVLSSDPDVLPEPCPAPALIMCGRQDFIVGYKKAWSIVENFPRASFVVLDRTGHWLILEQAALYQSLMNEWLDRVEEYSASH